jgi:catechol 2,3-dioxygenase
MTTLQKDTPISLHHLHVTSENPAVLAEFYSELFDLKIAAKLGDSIALSGRSRALVIHRGKSGELAAAAYAIRDEKSLAHLKAKLSGAAEPAGEMEQIFFRPGAIRVGDPQGRVLIIGVPQVPRSADDLPARRQHTVFQTTQLEKIIDFYVKTVGFTISDEVVDVDGQVATCFLRSDDEHHSLAFFRGSQNVWDHHCYETSSWNDIRDWGDRFAHARRPIFFGPGRHGPGNNLFFMVTDPDGNRVELSAELQRVDAAQPPGVWPHEEYTLNSWGRGWIRT